MKTLDLLKKLENVKVRGAWNNGVKEYAIYLIGDNLADSDYTEINDLEELKEVILNGSSDWKQFSYDGWGFVYDEEICKTLCSPSEYKRLHYKEGGVKQPNKRETWCDVEARALFQAWEMIKRTYNEMDK